MTARRAGWSASRIAGLQRHVRDDERGAARRRDAGPRAVRGRLSERGAYAKDRLQGRALSGAKEPGKPADPIIVHPDVRRMLLEIRAFNEAARALVLWTALDSDIAHRSDDAAARQAADDRLGLLTPVLKGVLTDLGFDNTVKAQQMLRRPRLYRRMGHGAVRARCPHRHDLRRRQRHPGARSRRPQAAADGGRAIMAFFKERRSCWRRIAADEAMKPFAAPLQGGARRSAAGDDVVHAERHDEARQCRRRLQRLHASLRPRRARLHVGAASPRRRWRRRRKSRRAPSAWRPSC